MDQLRVHKTHAVKNKLEEFNWRCLFNAAYFPDGNGIEYFFSQVKDAFKKMRLHAIINGKRDKPKQQL